MRLALTLRLRLLLLWLFILGVSGALALLVRNVYLLGSEAQTGRTLDLARQACATLSAEYPRAAAATPGRPDAELMMALLNLVLGESPGVEGGFWHDRDGFVAYAYPTHQGSEVKRDMPSTERQRIEALVHRSLTAGTPVNEVTARTRETVVLTAAPVELAGSGLVTWTMSRVPTATGQAYDQVNQMLALLLVFALLSGGWLAYGFQRWTRHLGRIERELASVDLGGRGAIALTGDAELDRMVVAVNGYRDRLEEARVREIELGTALAQSERFGALGRMAGAVAHEVRNPIAAMRLKAENALAGADPPEGALRFIVREIERLDTMVRSLLSKSERFELHRRDVAIADWVGERVAAFEQRAAQQGVELRTHVEPGTWNVDPSALGRAFDNLLANALAHTPRGGRIEVSAARGPEDAMRLSVCDSGPGVAAEIEPRLFEPFVSGRPDGVGLGLTLVREIALAHGGTSRHIRPATGACFEIEIPWRAS